MVKDIKNNLSAYSELSDNLSETYILALQQYFTLLDFENKTSLEINLNKLKEQDKLIMGKILYYGICFIAGIPSHFDQQFLNWNIENLTFREKLYYKSITLLAKKDFDNVLEILTNLISDDPCDLLAIKFCHDICFYLGKMDFMFQIYEKFYKSPKRKIPLYDCILAMYAFALVEIGDIDRAEYLATKALTMNPINAWATHSLAHVYTMKAQAREGIDFLLTTRHDWAQSDYLACHLYWHLGIFYFDQGHTQKAYDIFHCELRRRLVKSNSLFHLTDAVSLLVRISRYGMLDDIWFPRDLGELNAPASTFQRLMIVSESLITKTAIISDWSFLAFAIIMMKNRYLLNHYWTFNDVHISVTLAMCKYLLNVTQHTAKVTW